MTVQVTNPNFTLECLGSGDEPTITWTLNGNEVSGQEFEDQEDTPETGGEYEYGQASAVRSSIKWIPPARHCSTVDRHQGEYKFVVTAHAGGWNTYAESRGFDLAVECKQFQMCAFLLFMISLIHSA